MTDQGFREQLLESLPDAVFVVGHDGRIVVVNAQAEQLFGYPREALVGQPIEILVPEAVRPVHPAHRSRYLTAPQVRPMGAGLDLSGRRADGTEFPAEISLSALETEDGRLVTAVVRDVTERRKTQAKFEGLLEAAPDAMVGVDAGGLIRLVNSQTERLFGYHRSELLGHPIEILVPASAREIHPRHRQKYFSSPDMRPMGAGIELHGLRRDGSEFPAEISLSSIETEDGILVTAAVRDVSERKAFELEVERARDTAERAARARQDFLANMSHEIRTPMNAVIGLTSLLLDTRLDAEQRDYLETVRASGDHLLTIINDILDYAKIDSGKIVLDQARFRVAEWAEEAMDLVASQAADKGLELVLEIHPDVPPVVVGDPGRLRQVLINVLSNAVKFTPLGEIVVRLDALDRAPGRCVVRVRVRDTGIGIAAHRLAMLFDPFTQADTTTTREFGGTGLGLAISRRLTELMGGAIDMDSTPGRGTTVTFTFDVPAVDEAPGPRPQLGGSHVLLIDDNDSARRALEAWLQRVGLEVSIATTAQQALRAATDVAPFAALIDSTLPDSDSALLARSLRERIPGMRLVLMSPAGTGGRDRSTEAYDAVVQKPFRRAQLLQALGLTGPDDSARTSAPESSPFVLTRAGRLSILVVEDNPMNQMVARHLLARFGYRADVVSSGLEALDSLGTRSYDLVLMDVQMPDMDGLETTQLIRQRFPDEGPRIVAMTANVSQSSVAACLAAGMDGFLGKPIVVADLASLLENVNASQSSTGAAGTGGATLDTTVLDKLTKAIGAANVRELIELYSQDATTLAPDLARAAASGDTDTVVALAHRLRSASRTLGAPHLADLFAELEQRTPPVSELAERVQPVLTELEHVIADLNAVSLA